MVEMVVVKNYITTSSLFWGQFPGNLWMLEWRHIFCGSPSFSIPNTKGMA